MAISRHIGIAADQFVIGTDTALQFNCTQVDGVTPQTMTGWALEFIIRDSTPDGSGAPRVTKTTGGGIVISNGAGTNDRATVSIAAVDTLSLPPGWGYDYALWRTNSGSAQVLAFGGMTLTAAAKQ